MSADTWRDEVVRRGSLLVGMAAVLWAGGVAVAAVPDPAAPPVPVNERLSYKVSWMGIHCGRMTLTSFTEGEGAAVTYHIVMTARTSKFFDGVYRVRSRIESTFSPRAMATVRYHDLSREKKRVTDDLYEFDLEAGQVERTRNGERETFPIERDRVHDPLAFIYRLRRLVEEPGKDVNLVLATSHGALETVAHVDRRKRIKTPLGRREALLVVPQPEDGMLFSKSGRMEIWMGTDDERTPYKVVFDLSFGKLVAKLIDVERGPGLSPPEVDQLPGDE